MSGTFYDEEGRLYDAEGNRVFEEYEPENLPGSDIIYNGKLNRSDGLNLIRADSLRPEPIDWVWKGWLAAGKFHVLGGAPC
jgi:hypothetical protein